MKDVEIEGFRDEKIEKWGDCKMERLKDRELKDGKIERLKEVQLKDFEIETLKDMEIERWRD